MSLCPLERSLRFTGPVRSPQSFPVLDQLSRPRPSSSEYLVPVLFNFLNPIPNLNQDSHSALMMRTMFVGEGCPRLLRSCTVIKPSARASRSAF
jgi:hypothetical protein